MDIEKVKVTRKNGRHLRVPVLPQEEELIKANAIKAGLTTAEYLRRLGLNYPIKSVVDKEHILQLAKINADMGRLGGLLKLWLGNDRRLENINPKNIAMVLDSIKENQGRMLSLVKKL